MHFFVETVTEPLRIATTTADKKNIVNETPVSTTSKATAPSGELKRSVVLLLSYLAIMLVIATAYS